jgi:diguanylate cyclase (GGDEF)-like protein
LAPDTSTPQRLILVVDDDEHTRNLLRDLCEASGFKVIAAEDGVACLERLPKDNPDMVLLDLMMPRKDGFAVLKTMREDARFKDIPVIVLTAMGDMDGKIRGMELGADDYVTKPFKLIELQTRINATLTVRDYRKRLTAVEEELSHLRALDPVTGAGTYAQLKASLDGELARSRRYGRPAAALMLVLDDYQGLRYQLGRDGSTALVAQFAAAIRDALRGADRLFRLDADEFIILLPETDLKGAHVTARRLYDVVTKVKPAGGNVTFDLRLRIGGAAFPHDRVRSSEDLLREANNSIKALRARSDNARVFET